MKREQNNAAGVNNDRPDPLLRDPAAGMVAQKIISLAQKNGVPVREDRHLIEILSTIDPVEDVPAELYKAVSEILSFVHAMSGRM